MTELRQPSEELTRWERERNAMIRAAVDQDDLQTAFSLILDMQVAFALIALRVGNFPPAVHPISGSTGVMPLRALRTIVVQACAHMEGRGSEATRDERAGCAALEAVFNFRVALGQLKASGSLDSDLLLRTIMTAVRCGTTEAILAGERQGFFERNAEYLRQHDARQAGASKANAQRSAWHTRAPEYAREMRATDPLLSGQRLVRAVADRLKLEGITVKDDTVRRALRTVGVVSGRR